MSKRRKGRRPKGMVGGNPFPSNPHLGIRRRAHRDPDNSGNVIIATSQDISAVTELNKAQYAATDERARHRSEGLGTHYARIPLSVLFDLKKKGILKDKKRFRAWLNDPDNRVFRTRPGRV